MEKDCLRRQPADKKQKAWVPEMEIVEPVVPGNKTHKGNVAETGGDEL